MSRQDPFGQQSPQGTGAKRNPSSGEPRRQQIATIGQAARQRAFGDSELPRDFLASTCLQVAQNDWCLVLLGEAIQLMVEQAPPVLDFRRSGYGLNGIVHLRLFGATPRTHGS